MTIYVECDVRERRQREAEAIETLRAWAVAHDERSRLLIEEQHDGWRAVAEDAWLDAHTPDGFTPLPRRVAVADRTKPSTDDIYALRAVRQIVAQSGGALENARLAWTTIYRHEPDHPDADQDGDVVETRQAAVLLDVVAPTHIVYRPSDARQARRTVWAPAGSAVYQALSERGRG